MSATDSENHILKKKLDDAMDELKRADELVVQGGTEVYSLRNQLEAKSDELLA